MKKSSCSSSWKSFLAIPTLVIATAMAVSGCGNNDLGRTTTVFGKVTTNNAAVSGATVYIPGATVPTKSLEKNLTVTVNCAGTDQQITCTDPGEVSCASTCTCPDGSYKLGTAQCAEGSSTIVVLHQNARFDRDIDCNDSNNNLSCEINLGI